MFEGEKTAMLWSFRKKVLGFMNVEPSVISQRAFWENMEWGNEKWSGKK